MGCEEHGDAAASSWNGEDRSAPVVGDVTVTAEKTETVEPSSETQTAAGSNFMSYALELPEHAIRLARSLVLESVERTSMLVRPASPQIHSTRNLWIVALKVRDGTPSVNTLRTGKDQLV